MKLLGTSSAALGTSLPRPFWRRHRYLQPTKQSSVWRLLSVSGHPPSLAQSPLSRRSLPSTEGHPDLCNVPPWLPPSRSSSRSWHRPPWLPSLARAGLCCTCRCSAQVQFRVSPWVAVLDMTESWASRESVHLFFTGRWKISWGRAGITQYVSHMRYWR